MSEPVLLVRARKLRAARGVAVARDVTLDAAPATWWRSRAERFGDLLGRLT